jgi:autotransporter-associated beta strand protein
MKGKGEVSVKAIRTLLILFVALAALRFESNVQAQVNEWNVNGGGTFGTAGNWTMGTPTAGSTVLFGGVLTAENSPAMVTLAAPATLGEIQFNNANATYILAGASLTLNGAAIVSTVAGNHEISAHISGTAGLTKTGTGQLTLSAGNSVYSGTTNVQAGSLRIRDHGAVPGTVNVDTGASVFFEGNSLGGGFNGIFTPDITGAGEVGTSGLLTNETVTFNNAKSYTGQTTIIGGILSLTGAGTLGTSDGSAATRTLIDGNQSMGRLSLSGGINVTNELLVLEARELAALNSVHLSSSGANTWGGNIKGEVGGTQYNIESTSGTLTLGGTISAPDTATRNFVFSGAGNFNVTGKIIDSPTGADGVSIGASALSNVNIIKRGNGKLTIGTASGIIDDYWRGTTTIEAGTLEVLSDGSNNGELASSAIAVRAGAALDIDHFSSYSMQVGQDLSGAGTVHTQDLSIFGDNLLSPGDGGIGTLTFQGPSGLGPDVAIGSDFLSTVGARGGVAFDLSAVTTVGGSSNDLITGVRNLTFDVRQFADDFVTPEGTDSPIEILVNPSQNQLAGGGAGTYRLINYTGTLTNSANAAVTFAPQLQGLGTTRQTLAISTATAGQVNLVVSGAIANLTWNGSAGNSTWDVDTSTNWTGADGKFKNLDNVTFGAGGVKDVTLNSNVAPGIVNFNSGLAAAAYTINGSGGIVGGATVNVNSGLTRLRNRGNNYSGTTTIANGARLEMETASTGAMVVNGTLAVPSTLTVTTIDTFSDTSLTEYTFTKILDQGAVTNTSFSSPAGIIASTSTGADGAEQVLFLRNDGFNLDVGEELRVDNALTQANGNDLGIVVGATPTAGVRQNYLFVSFRGPTQLNSRGFIGSTEVGQLQAFGVTVSDLFIARTDTSVFELGYYDNNGTRTIMRTEDVGANVSIANNVGFYSDLRADGVGYNGLDNLVITTGTPNNTVSIAGNLTLAATGTLELDVSAFDFTALDVSGSASLAGTLSINLLNGFQPAEGASYAFLSADGGITNAGLTFDLPALTVGLSWDTSDFFTTGVLSVVAAGLAGDFDNDGDVDGRDFLAWQRGNSPNPLSAGDLAAWQANYGSNGPLVATSTSVPEPGTLAALLGLLALACGQRTGRGR